MPHRSQLGGLGRKHLKIFISTSIPSLFKYKVLKTGILKIK